LQHHHHHGSLNHLEALGCAILDCTRKNKELRATIHQEGLANKILRAAKEAGKRGINLDKQ